MSKFESKPDGYLNKIKSVVEKEYIYIYNSEVCYLDISFDRYILRNDVTGAVLTTTDNYNIFIIENRKKQNGK